LYVEKQLLKAYCSIETTVSKAHLYYNEKLNDYLFSKMSFL